MKMQSVSRRSQEEMFPLIERYQSSGKTQKAFCSEEGLAPSVLSYWLRKYRHKGEEKKTGFLALSLEDSTSSLGLELHFEGGFWLRFPRGSAPGEVLAFIQELRDA